ncbi:IS5/IS1182 family transposase [Roseomonas gilardii]|nr:IS5/IS1182 family transposase [Roseomonas gilardii]
MRATPILPSHPLTDAEWSALSPYLPHDPRHRGRPVAEGPRARMDAIFAHALTPLPWCALPAQHGRADTIARFFRRLTHAGVWGRLLTALATLPAQHPLQSLRHRICRAARRAYRILGMGLILLARRLNLRSALPGPPWLLPDPDLSETLRRAKLPPLPTRRGTITAYRAMLRTLMALYRTAAGRRRIAPVLRWSWP